MLGKATAGLMIFGRFASPKVDFREGIDGGVVGAVTGVNGFADEVGCFLVAFLLVGVETEPGEGLGAVGFAVGLGPACVVAEGEGEVAGEEEGDDCPRDAGVDGELLETVLTEGEFAAEGRHRLGTLQRIVVEGTNDQRLEEAAVTVAAEPAKGDGEGIDVSPFVKHQLVADLGRHAEPGADALGVRLCRGGFAKAAEVEEDGDAVDESDVLSLDVAMEPAEPVEQLKRRGHAVNDALEGLAVQFARQFVRALHDEVGRAVVGLSAAIAFGHEAGERLADDEVAFAAKVLIRGGGLRSIVDLQRSGAEGGDGFAYAPDRAGTAVAEIADDRPRADDGSPGDHR